MSQTKPLIALILVFIFCNFNTMSSQATETDDEVTVEFINDYVAYCNDLATKVSQLEWIQNRKDVTNSFRSELERIVSEAESNDPELGLGFDPILDAQDYPNSFEIESQNSEYVVVKGIDWPEFKLTLKLKIIEGKYFVDGSGIINIPEGKRIKR
ncbi:hypothetical protein LB452_03435 [Psychroflexus sp. CAK8W]|uniref:DUF3828 domain-containing protein n=1 Tax=Psychroflexus longus TaxID=2873596 RepID=A0ABS7XG81_9FLAO|nr:hypothetical protein [Psychroflexus longus]MBZ9777967.1 hypothetical protein [Psychroflexus longus]